MNSTEYLKPNEDFNHPLAELSLAEVPNPDGTSKTEEVLNGFAVAVLTIEGIRFPERTGDHGKSCEELFFLWSEGDADPLTDLKGILKQVKQHHLPSIMKAAQLIAHGFDHKLRTAFEELDRK